MEIEQIDDILESLLFVSGDGLKVSDICEMLELQKSEVTSAVKRLQKRFGGKHGIHLISYSGKLQLASNPDYAETISCVLNPIMEKALSSPAMETLSIIEYRQPVTRMEIESIRGVNSDYALQALMRNNLIEVVGRKDAIGKPLLFGTTENFLRRFGIENIEELPDRDTLIERIRTIELTAETEVKPEEKIVQLYNFENKSAESGENNAQASAQAEVAAVSDENTPDGGV